MNPKLQPATDAVSRRGLLAIATTAGSVRPGAVRAATPQRATARDKRRPLYRAGSDEVQVFYRVNRYPAK